MQRYRVDTKQAARVAKLADTLALQFSGGEELSDSNNWKTALHLLDWAAHLHEIGISVSHSGYHKHTAYILANADMPGFSKKEQARLSLLALAQRGNLSKLQGQLKNSEDYILAMSLRLAVLFYRNRSDIALPVLHSRFSGTKFHLSIDPDWLAQNPLTEAALQDEVKQWKALGVGLQIVEA
jgi:exopolyphosphatase/guanosine-5'-triphosphate,3'-diphosphate pyrophosphatase